MYVQAFGGLNMFKDAPLCKNGDEDEPKQAGNQKMAQ